MRRGRGRFVKGLAFGLDMVFVWANMSEQTPPDSNRRALPLAAAARRIGLNPDALRMRIYRGKAEGFKLDGRLFVYVESDPNERTNDVQPEAPEMADPRASLADIQRGEIRWLMRENQRLAAEIERFLGLQEREQAMRGEIREAIGQIAVSRTASASEVARLEARIERSERKTEQLAGLVGQLVRRMSRRGPQA